MADIFICKPLVAHSWLHMHKTILIILKKEQHFYSLDDCWKCTCTNLTNKNLWSCDGTVTSPTSHITNVSVCSHWLVSPSEPAGCDCLAHNATGKTRALDSHWSADGCERGISSVLQSTHPELCVCVSVSVFMSLHILHDVVYKYRN